MRQLLKRILYPFLNKWLHWYLSKPRFYHYQGLKLKIYPGVFHPGWLISTRILLEFILKQDIKGKSLLELGAGSGLISLVCARNGAFVTASDINPTAVAGLQENARGNGKIAVQVILSDLFDSIDEQTFDFMLINPPYYPKDPANDRERAFYCGAGFEYFKKLVVQLPAYLKKESFCWMILSEDCDIAQIKRIFENGGFTFTETYKVKKWGEWNYVYLITN